MGDSLGQDALHEHFQAAGSLSCWDCWIRGVKMAREGDGRKVGMMHFLGYEHSPEEPGGPKQSEAWTQERKTDATMRELCAQVDANEVAANTVGRRGTNVFMNEDREFDTVGGMFLDIFHLVLEGVVKRFWSLLLPKTVPAPRPAWVIPNEGRQKLSRPLCLTIPNHVESRPRNFVKYHLGYTAQEWADWIVIYSVWALHDPHSGHGDVLPRQLQHAWSCLRAAALVLIARHATWRDWDVADRLLKDFANTMSLAVPADVPNSQTTWNVHMLVTHARERVEVQGRLSDTWCFWIERCMQWVKNKVPRHVSQSPEHCVVRQYLIEHKLRTSPKDIRLDLFLPSSRPVTDAMDYDRTLDNARLAAGERGATDVFIGAGHRLLLRRGKVRALLGPLHTTFRDWSADAEFRLEHGVPTSNPTRFAADLGTYIYFYTSVDRDGVTFHTSSHSTRTTARASCHVVVFFKDDHGVLKPYYATIRSFFKITYKAKPVRLMKLDIYNAAEPLRVADGLCLQRCRRSDRLYKTGVIQPISTLSRKVILATPEDGPPEGGFFCILPTTKDEALDLERTLNPEWTAMRSTSGGGRRRRR